MNFGSTILNCDGASNHYTLRITDKYRLLKNRLFVLVVVGLALVVSALALVTLASGILGPLFSECTNDIGQTGPCPPEYYVTPTSVSLYATNGNFSFVLILLKSSGWPGTNPVTLPIQISSVTMSGVDHNASGTTTTMAGMSCFGSFAPLNKTAEQIPESCTVSGLTFNSSSPGSDYVFLYVITLSDGQAVSGSVAPQ
jgi:hypothetical protein